MGFSETEKFLWVGISFFAFLLTCGALLESRFTGKRKFLIMGGLLIGIIALQVGLLFSRQDQTLVLTMLPLTLYLPAVIGVHVISKAGFFQTVAIWTLGLLISYTLTFLQKFLIRFLDFKGNTKGFVITACLFFAACILLLIVFRYIRRSFFTYVLNNNVNWLPLCFPIVMIFLLFSYFKNSVTNPVIWILIFLTALSIFLVIAKALVSTASALRIQEAEKAVSAQLGIQRREYEDICKKMELGRAYRHDMRHHLTVLNSLAGEKNNEEIVRYISGLDVQIGEIEQETYCENVTVNAVLSSYIGQAKETGCTVTSNVQVPSLLPFDPLDICAILANSLENAIHACQNNSAGEDRNINLTAVFEEERRFVVSVANHCEKELPFDKDGLPIVLNREEHGIGLKSVKTIAEKYNGLFRCECKESAFLLRAILFDSQEMPRAIERKPTVKKVVTATLMSLFIFCLAVNYVPAVQALAGIPVLGNLIRVVDFRSYDFHWGDTKLHIDLPKAKLEESPADNAIGTHSSALKPTDEISLPQSEPEQATASENTPREPQITSLLSGAISWKSDGETDADTDVTSPPAVSPEPPPSDASPVVSPEPPPSDAPPVVSPEPPSSDAPPVVSPEPPSSDAPPDLSEGIDDINRQMQEYIKLLREKFLWHVARKYNGYVAMDSTYTTLRNDDRFLLIRFDTTLNAGGSGAYSRCFMLDKQSGKVIELWDLFKGNSDYISVVSNEILRQMTEQVDAGLADYFIPGGIWSDEECFKRIAADQNFYINDKNQLVIVFDEYKVTPGKDGMPEFIIHTDALKDILRQPSLLN